MPRPDESEIEDLRRGRGETFERAFAAVYEREKRVVYGLLLRLGGDPTTAADLFQNVWLKLARHAHRLRPDTNTRAWLCTVARRELISHRRAQALDLSRWLAWGRPEEPSSTPPTEVHEVNSALRRLSEADREVLLIVSVDGLDQRSAAAVLGLSEVALRKRVARARARLSKLLDVPEELSDARGACKGAE